MAGGWIVKDPLTQMLEAFMIGGMYREKKTGKVYELFSMNRTRDEIRLYNDAESHVWIVTTYTLQTEWETVAGDSQWGWGEHCWHTWKEYPLFTSVEIRCSKCGKLKEKDDERPTEEAR